MQSGIENLVDLERYPLDEPGGPRWRAAVRLVREGLNDDGCSVVPGFVRADRLEALRTEGVAVAPAAYYEVQTVNVYNTDVTEGLDDDHPARIELRRENAFVARDLIPAGAIIHRLYREPAFQRFVAECFGLAEVHELADPLAGLVLNVVSPGLGHPWHFDTNEFAVSLLTQAPEGGGTFEYCPQIRTRDDENLPAVRSVLEGRGEHLVRRLTLRPGDLQLFRGRYSLHRVARVEGTRQRHTAIFSFTERPGVVGSAARTRQLFGRLLPEHRAAAGADGRIRVDQLLD